MDKPALRPAKLLSLAIYGPRTVCPARTTPSASSPASKGTLLAVASTPRKPLAALRALMALSSASLTPLQRALLLLQGQDRSQQGPTTRSLHGTTLAATSRLQGQKPLLSSAHRDRS